MQYPDTQGFAYSFQRAELTGPSGKIFKAIGSVSTSQPTEEGVVKGTAPYPLMRTVGSMGLGEGTIGFTDEGERIEFLTELGDAWREKTWVLVWYKSAPNRPPIKEVCFGCRVLDEATSDEEGTDALQGEITFSFMYRTLNGRVPHSGLPTT